MDNISNVKVNIKEAKITDITIDLESIPPKISATIQLLTPTGKTISQFTMSAPSYNKDTQIDRIPSEVFGYIGCIVAELMPCIARKLNTIDKQIEAPIETESEVFS